MALKSLAQLLRFSRKNILKNALKENYILNQRLFESSLLLEELMYVNYVMQVKIFLHEIESKDNDNINQILFNSKFYTDVIVKDTKRFAPDLISFGKAGKPDTFIGLEVNTLGTFSYGNFLVATKENMEKFINSEKINMVNNFSISKQLSEDEF